MRDAGARCGRLAPGCKVVETGSRSDPQALLTAPSRSTSGQRSPSLETHVDYTRKMSASTCARRLIPARSQSVAGICSQLRQSRTPATINLHFPEQRQCYMQSHRHTKSRCRTIYKATHEVEVRPRACRSPSITCSGKWPDLEPFRIQIGEFSSTSDETATPGRKQQHACGHAVQSCADRIVPCNGVFTVKTDSMHVQNRNSVKAQLKTKN